MSDELGNRIKELIEQNESLLSVKTTLLEEGFMEDDIDKAIHGVSTSNKDDEKKKVRHISHLVTGKDVFERVGYGFGSQQFINILFYISGASLFLIGIVNGIKSLLSVMISSFLQDFSEEYEKNRSALVMSGILLAMSIFSIAIAIYLNNLKIFAGGIIVGAICVVFYGDLYHRFTKTVLKTEHVPFMLRRMSHIGVVISAISLFIGAMFLQRSSNGYIYVLGISSVALLISVIFVFFLPTHNTVIHEKKKMWAQVKVYYSRAFGDMKFFMGNWILFILIVTGTISGVVQALGNTYYGIFIYKYLGGWGYGRFMNVAIVFSLALLTSLLAPHISRRNAKQYGKFPMLVFGTLLMAILPFTFVVNPHLTTVAIAVVLGVIGASISGIARGLLAIEYIPENKRKNFFVLSGVITTIPYLILFPLGAWLVSDFGMKYLFKILGFALVLFVVPLYFLVVLLHNKQRVKI